MAFNGNIATITYFVTVAKQTHSLSQCSKHCIRQNSPVVIHLYQNKVALCQDGWWFLTSGRYVCNVMHFLKKCQASSPFLDNTAMLYRGNQILSMPGCIVILIQFCLQIQYIDILCRHIPQTGNIQESCCISLICANKTFQK